MYLKKDFFSEEEKENCCRRDGRVDSCRSGL